MNFCFPRSLWFNFYLTSPIASAPEKQIFLFLLALCAFDFIFSFQLQVHAPTISPLFFSTIPSPWIFLSSCNLSASYEPDHFALSLKQTKKIKKKEYHFPSNPETAIGFPYTNQMFRVFLFFFPEKFPGLTTSLPQPT